MIASTWLDPDTCCLISLFTAGLFTLCLTSLQSNVKLPCCQSHPICSLLRRLPLYSAFFAAFHCWLITVCTRIYTAVICTSFHSSKTRSLLISLSYFRAILFSSPTVHCSPYYLIILVSNRSPLSYYPLISSLTFQCSLNYLTLVSNRSLSSLLSYFTTYLIILFSSQTNRSLLFITLYSRL